MAQLDLNLNALGHESEIERNVGRQVIPFRQVAVRER